MKDIHELTSIEMVEEVIQQHELFFCMYLVQSAVYVTLYSPRSGLCLNLIHQYTWVTLMLTKWKRLRPSFLFLPFQQ